MVEASELSEVLPQTSSRAEINDAGLLGWRRVYRERQHTVAHEGELFGFLLFVPLIKIMTLFLAFLKREVKKRAALVINGRPHQGQSMDGVLGVKQGAGTPSQNCPGTFEQGTFALT